MQWKVSMIVLIGLSVLCVTGCGTVRRTVTSEATDLRIQESKEVTARDSVVVELRDTLVETTTITIDRNEVGDTLKVVQVTERERVRSRADVRSKKEEVRVVRDTVYVERRDSVLVDRGQVKGDSYQSRGTALHRTLKWVFWIVVAITVLVVIIKVSRFFRV